MLPYCVLYFSSLIISDQEMAHLWSSPNHQRKATILVDYHCWYLWWFFKKILIIRRRVSTLFCVFSVMCKSFHLSRSILWILLCLEWDFGLELHKYSVFPSPTSDPDCDHILVFPYKSIFTDELDVMHSSLLHWCKSVIIKISSSITLVMVEWIF